MRTTINIDDPLLEEVKRLAAQKGLPLGRVVSDLLADALHDQERVRKQRSQAEPFRLITKRMGTLLDVDDTAALLDAVDQADGPKPRRTAKPKARRR